MELVLIREDARIIKWVSKYELDHREGIHSSDKQHMQSLYYNITVKQPTQEGAH